ncbi:MAG: orotate phosphoribosyltransferase [Deltaproteobacteria bacterium]|nr:MAG: orotate phosphoribosyltransferase [Deltaproteobacteria bacterium]TNF27726.1 MAG: orotate phosphoribosyltransferase [Deltaproteobacteria bacterium]
MNAESIANLLVKIECLKVSPSDPFTYASGLKGPLYCDNRKALGYVEERELIVKAFVERIKAWGKDFDAVCGLATAGIPHAAFIADALKKPMIYVRSKPKAHGKGNQVEGHYEAGQKIIMIEDLVNQGKSLAEALDGVRNAQLDPLACFCIVDYQMAAAKEVIRSYQLELISLTNFDSILKSSLEQGFISEEEGKLLVDWQRDPANWKNHP